MNVINPRPQFNPPFSSNTFNKVIWADLPMNLEISPLTGDLTKIINQNAIEASMENIIETFQYERPYDDSGCAVKMRLFDNISPLIATLIQSAVQLAIKQYEPRVVLKNVIVNVNSDADSYTLEIYYSLTNNPSVILTFNKILQRTSD